MTKLPKLYPGHQHQWADVCRCGHTTDRHEAGECWTRLSDGEMTEDDEPDRCRCWWYEPQPTKVRCTVCGFQAPRNAAGLDGRMPQEPYHPPRPAHCPICSPEQETR